MWTGSHVVLYIMWAFGVIGQDQSTCRAGFCDGPDEMALVGCGGCQGSCCAMHCRTEVVIKSWGGEVSLSTAVCARAFGSLLMLASFSPARNQGACLNLCCFLSILLADHRGTVIKAVISGKIQGYQTQTRIECLYL